jgi:hypothetical protein
MEENETVNVTEMQHRHVRTGIRDCLTVRRGEVWKDEKDMPCVLQTVPQQTTNPKRLGRPWEPLGVMRNVVTSIWNA